MKTALQLGKILDSKEQNTDKFNFEDASPMGLFVFLYIKKKVILRCVVLFTLMGIIHALTSPNEFKTEIQLMPESRSNSALSGTLSGLAGLAGINIGDLQDKADINPDLYPNILESTSFLIEFMNQSFFFESLGEKMTLFEYFNEYEKKSLIGNIFSFPSLFFQKKALSSEIQKWGENEILHVSKEQLDILKKISERTIVSVDKLSGVITISFKMQDAGVSAEGSDFVMNYITNYVIEYRTSKEKRNLSFVEERVAEARARFYKAQEDLSSFRDRNINIATARSRSEEERLQSEYNLAFNLYNGLAQQLEQTRIAVQEETPVFKMLEPVKIPKKKYSPRKVLITGVAVVLGLFCGIGIIFIQLLKPKFQTLFESYNWKRAS